MSLEPSQPRAHWCEALYDAQAARLILYGRALGLSHGEAEDVVQEVFVTLLSISDAPEKPEFYLVRAVRNRVFNHRRSLWRRWVRELESRRWFETTPDETPAEKAAVACLQRLPPDQREVIVLKIWHGYTFEEIGLLQQRSPNTIAGRYRYGMERLRACLRNPATQEALESHESEPSIDRSADRSLVLLDAPTSLPGA